MDNNDNLNQDVEETLYDEMEAPMQLPNEENEEEVTYQATARRNDKKQKSDDANKKVSKIATQAVGHYFGGSEGGKVVNAINNTKVGDKLNEAIGRRMTDMSKRSLAGRMAQNTINKLDEKGALDKGQEAMDALGSSSGANKLNALNPKTPKIPNAPKTPGSGAPTQKKNFVMNPKKSSIDMSKDKKNQLVRKKIFQFIIKHPWILAIVLVLFLLMIIMLVILGGGGGAASEEANNNSSRSISDACSDFPLNSTSLSKSEFVSLVQENITRYNRAPNEFKNTKDLETMYNVATKNNCNPELVVARAIQEGFTGGKYNYWGIAVYNGQTSGNGYSSLSEGVLAFCNIVSRYSTLYDLNHAYGYIGDYWANKGNNSYGGCTYIDYTYEYYDNKSRADEVKAVCAKNQCPLAGKSPENPSKCLKTNEEDQDAYTKYQNWALTTHRKNVFGLEPDQCLNPDSDFGNFDRCTIFNQVDPRWADRNIGLSGTKMDWGCAVTSVSIGISCFGNKYDPRFNPGKFLDLANSSKYVSSCFTGANIYWTCPAIQVFAPNINYVAGIVQVLGPNIDYKVNFINSFDPNKHFFIVQIINARTSTHFVVLKSINRAKGTFTCLNPSGGVITEEKLKDINAVRVFTK